MEISLEFVVWAVVSSKEALSFPSEFIEFPLVGEGESGQHKVYLSSNVQLSAPSFLAVWA